MKLRTLALITIFIFSTQIATAQATDLYTLSIIAFDGGTTDPAPEVYLDQSVQTKSIRAIPDPGYEFSHWEDRDGNKLSENIVLTLTLDKDTNIEAHFKVVDDWPSPRLDAGKTGYDISGVPMFPKIEWINRDSTYGDREAPVLQDGYLYTSFDGHLAKLDASTGEVKWVSTETQSDMSSPTVQGDRVYTMIKPHTVHCYDVVSGNLVWNYQIDEHTNYLRDVTVSGGVVYAVSNKRLVLLDASNGVEMKTMDFMGDIKSPTVIGGRVYLNVNNSVTCWDSTLTKRYWITPVSENLDTEPVYAGGYVYIGTSQGNLYAFNSAGEIAWVYAAGGGITQPPAIWEGKLIVSVNQGEVHCVSGGSHVWKVTLENPGYMSAPVLSGSLCFVTDYKGRLYSIDMITPRIIQTSSLSNSFCNLAAGGINLYAVDIHQNIMCLGSGRDIDIRVQGYGTTNPAPGTYEFTNTYTGTITATPDENNYFRHWLVNNLQVDDYPLELSATDSKKVVAVFEAKKMVTISVEGDGYTNPALGTYYQEDPNAPETYVAYANTGSEFKHWIVNDEVHSTDPNLSLWLTNEENTVKAVFTTTSTSTEPDISNNDEALINYAIEGEGETAPPLDSLPLEGGGYTIVEAVPDDGYLFDYWEINGETYTDNPVSYDFKEDDNVTVYFKEEKTKGVPIPLNVLLIGLAFSYLMLRKQTPRV